MFPVLREFFKAASTLLLTSIDVGTLIADVRAWLSLLVFSSRLLATAATFAAGAVAISSS